mgnify:FL=1
MAELEAVIEKRLIEQLCTGESQWTYRPDIRTEEQLWDNFKYILEHNNKAKLNDEPLSDSEFAKIKNDLSHASFYDAAKWLVGENGKVYVHVQRGNKDNQKVGEMLHMLITDIENDREKYLGQDVSVIFNKMRSDIIDKEIDNFTNKWFLNREDVKFGAYHYKNGKPENESVLKENAQYAEYRDTVENPISPKFKFNKTMIKEFSDDLMDKIFPLLK